MFFPNRVKIFQNRKLKNPIVPGKIQLSSPFPPALQPPLPAFPASLIPLFSQFSMPCPPNSLCLNTLDPTAPSASTGYPATAQATCPPETRLQPHPNQHPTSGFTASTCSAARALKPPSSARAQVAGKVNHCQAFSHYYK